MEIATQNVVVIGSGSPALTRVVPLLCRANIQVRSVTGAEALSLLPRERVDLLVVRVPAAGATLADLLVAARRAGGAGTSPRVLVLADEEAEATVRPWLGRGVDRAVSLDATSERLLTAVAELLPARNRRAERLAVQLAVRWRGPAGPGEGSTVNLSSAGMMVEGRPAPPTGSAIDFTLELPAGRDAAGRGVVTRCAAGASGGDESFAVRFIAFEGDDWDRLAGLLGA